MKKDIIKEIWVGFRSSFWLADELNKAAKEVKRSRSDWMRLVLEEALEARKAKKERGEEE